MDQIQHSDQVFPPEGSVLLRKVGTSIEHGNSPPVDNVVLNIPETISTMEYAITSTVEYAIISYIADEVRC